MGTHKENGQDDQFIEELWKRSGGENPLGEFDSFQAAYDAAVERGETGHHQRASAIVTCIDEGITPLIVQQQLNLPEEPDILRTAGSGILHGDITHILRPPQVQGMLAHDWCGAAGVYARENNLTGNADDHGAQRIEQIAQATEVDYYGRILPTARPREFHDARAVYYDGTRKGFEASRISTLPKGFGVSRGFFGSQIGESDAALATFIAASGNMRSPHFTPQSPFYLVAISDDRPGSVPMEKLRDELSNIRKSAESMGFPTQIVTLDVSVTRGGTSTPSPIRRNPRAS